MTLAPCVSTSRPSDMYVCTYLSPVSVGAATLASTPSDRVLRTRAAPAAPAARRRRPNAELPCEVVVFGLHPTAQPRRMGLVVGTYTFEKGRGGGGGKRDKLGTRLRLDLVGKRSRDVEDTTSSVSVAFPSGFPRQHRPWPNMAFLPARDEGGKRGMRDGLLGQRLTVSFFDVPPLSHAGLLSMLEKSLLQRNASTIPSHYHHLALCHKLLRLAGRQLREEPPSPCSLGPVNEGMTPRAPARRKQRRERTHRTLREGIKDFGRERNANTGRCHKQPGVPTEQCPGS